METEVAYLSDVSLAYRLAEGQGEAITLLHPVGLDHDWLRTQQESFAQTHATLAVSLRGHGSSSRGTAPLTIDQLARDVLELWDTLRIGGSHLFGISLGGMVAQAIALERPSAVRSLALFATAATWDDAQRAAIEQRAQNTETNGIESTADETVERWFSDPGSELAHRARATLCANDAVVDSEWWRAIARLDLIDNLPAVRCPVLVVVGDADLSTPLPVAKRIAETVPNGALHTVTGGAHLWSIEEPQVAVALTQAFVDG